MSQPPLRLDDFRRLGQFRALTTAELRPLLEQELLRDFSAGAVVFRQGEVADHLLLVLSGQLRAWAEVDENAEPVGDNDMANAMGGNDVADSLLDGVQSLLHLHLKRCKLSLSDMHNVQYQRRAAKARYGAIMQMLERHAGMTINSLQL